MFKDTMEKIGRALIIASKVVALGCRMRSPSPREIGLPVIIRPAFTMGGTGGGIATTMEELHEIAENGLRLSPITEILVEKCISGWKEIEFEVMRDRAGNAITVCSHGEHGPGGHTHRRLHRSRSAQLRLSDRGVPACCAYLRTDIVTELGVEGGCNCQFALEPESKEYAVIEVNPRVSRSSALASKATGYPIAKVAAKIAIGYRLDEIRNAVTGSTWACFEPTVDYMRRQVPQAGRLISSYTRKRTLGTQMKATGEVMSIDDSFEQPIMKAVRGRETQARHPESAPRMPQHLTTRSENCVHVQDDQRLFARLRGSAPRHHDH